MTEFKLDGDCNIKQIGLAIDDPQDQFKVLRSIKIETTADIVIINALLGADAELFWQETVQVDPRWFSIKKVVLDVALTKHTASVADIDLGPASIKGFEFLAIGNGLAQLSFTIYPNTPPAASAADKLQQAATRTSVTVSIWRIPEPVTKQLFVGEGE